MRRLILIFALALAGCGGSEPATWTRVFPDDLSAADQARLEKARTATRSLGTGLMGALMDALAEGGPPNAITVCRDKAPEIAKVEAAALNGKVGRTSHRLRNPKNAPPPWLVNLWAEEPQIYLGPNGEMGVAMPIILQPLCVACHGPAEKLSPDVKRELDENYPDDQARDFEPGDVRGQFWVELPATR
jgi:hypothetical protein